MYLEEYGVDEFKLFEEWLYSGKLDYPKDSDDPSLVLVKIFCLAKDAEISNLQNATLDVICDRATEQRVSLTSPNTNHEIYAKPQGFFRSTHPPRFGVQNYQTTMTSPDFDEPVAKCLPPATASAVRYAYEKTSERSPLRRLLTDIFAYDVKPEALYEEDSLSFPAQFMADVLFITKKRLPLRLNGEEADFDENADKYHVHNLSSTCNDREQRTPEDVEVRGTTSDFDSREEPAAETANPEPTPDSAPDPAPEPEPPTASADPECEAITEVVAIKEDDTLGFEEPVRSSNKKDKKGKKSKKGYSMAIDEEPKFEPWN